MRVNEIKNCKVYLGSKKLPIAIAGPIIPIAIAGPIIPIAIGIKAFKIIRQYQHKLLTLFYQKDFNLTLLIKVVQDIQLALFLFAEKEEKKQNGKGPTINLFSIN